MAQSAPLVPLSLVGPGFAGLNTQTSSTIMGPEWASEAQNMVFDDSGRPAARKGWTSQTSTAITGTPEIEQLFEYVDLDGTLTIISAANDKLWSGVSSFTDITGSLTVTANNWQFANFYGDVYALQAGHDLVKWSGTGNFAAVSPSAGSVPDGNCLLAAFGRLWGTSADGQTLKYSVLLDGDDWGSIGSGSFNFAQVWGDGLDTIQALAAFNNYLVIFGKRHVILLQDDSGSTLGLDPNNARVSDTIIGVGCLARDSVQNVDGDDLVFLSYAGVQSIRRVIQAKGNPKRDVSRNVRDELMKLVYDVDADTIRSTYNPREGFYLLLLPSQNYIWCFDTRVSLEDGSWRVTRWNSFIPSALLTRNDRETLYSTSVGKIFKYSNYLDNTASYRLIYHSGWLVVNEQVADRMKILKRLASILFIGGNTSVIFKWGFDFQKLLNSVTKNTVIGDSGGEWGLAEWGEDEFGSGTGLNEFEVPAWGTGQFIKIGVEAIIDNTQVAIQQLQLFTKVGRLT